MDMMKKLQAFVTSKAVSECLIDSVDDFGLFAAVVCTIVDTWCKAHGKHAEIAGVVIAKAILDHQLRAKSKKPIVE